jgi:hypothetical protein
MVRDIQRIFVIRHFDWRTGAEFRWRHFPFRKLLCVHHRASQTQIFSRHRRRENFEVEYFVE